MDRLIESVLKSGVGCYVGNVASSILMYADDIVLLAPTRSAMQRLLCLCEEFCIKYKLDFSPDKCETLLLGFDSTNFELYINNKLIPLHHKVKHLGHHILNNRQLYDLNYMISDIKTRTNVMMSIFNFLDN